MGKLKEQLAPVQKHLFWIGCGLILAITLFSWYSATSTLKSEQARLKSEIDGKVGVVNAIPGNHPNDNTIKAMDELIQARGEEVAKKWARLTQNQENVLVWPSSVFDQEFIATVEPLRPPELKVTGQFITEISEDNRRYYRNYLIGVFPGLAKRIGSNWAGKVQAGGGGMAGGGMAGMPGGDGGGMSMPGAGGIMAGAGGQEEDDSIVLWNSANQSQLLNNHFGFIGSDTGLPTTLEILYAQEDLWVLESIMNIIKATNEANGPISYRYEAAVKVLESLTIGQSAVKESGKVSSAGGGGGGDGGGGEAPGMDMMEGMAGGGGGMGMAGGGDGMMPGAEGAGGAGGEGGAGGMMGGMTPGMGGMGGAGGKPGPGDNRYVDRDFKPVLSKRLIAAMKGQPEKPEDLFLAVAKRVPVRLNLKMDQRKLHTLLTACCNSKLPVEVKQIRINRQGGSGGGMDGGGGPGGMMDAGAMMAGMMGGTDTPGDEMGGAFAGAGGGSANNPNRKQIADSTIDTNEISLELYGIVYIYNPVNRAVLGLPETAAPAAITPPPATPVSNPAPPTTGPAPNTGAALGTSAVDTKLN